MVARAVVVYHVACVCPMANLERAPARLTGQRTPHRLIASPLSTTRTAKETSGQAGDALGHVHLRQLRRCHDKARLGPSRPPQATRGDG